MSDNIRWFDEIKMSDVPICGGKNASLGEMIQSLKKENISVPSGFATTADAYWSFLEHNQLKKKIFDILKDLRKDKKNLSSIGKKIRNLILKQKFPEDLKNDIMSNYQKLCSKYKKQNVDVAVRSSATAEDLPDASFAGQQESFLNVKGEKKLLESCQKCFASLFTNRAIAYREEKGFAHDKVALSIGIQKMVRSDKAGSGVMFTIDTETGFKNVVVINAAWGLGENVVQGTVLPDEYVIFKPLLNDNKKVPIIEKELGKKEKQMIYYKDTTKNINTPENKQKQFVLSNEEILKLANWACKIENHYKKPMDIEWAKDGNTKELFIVQARPETVESQKKLNIYKSYKIQQKGKRLLQGQAVGSAIATGKAQVIKSPKEIDKFKEGSILITEMTTPDWVPIMKKAKGIVTDHGGRTSHAAIVSRELGVPALVGTNNGTKLLKNDQSITLSCAEGDIGYVYDGIMKFEEKYSDLKKLPDVKTKIMINISSPSSAIRWWPLPCHGIGLARMEFIINNVIKIHPMALIHSDKVKDKKEKKLINELTIGYKNNSEYFVEKLATNIAKIAASQYPEPVIVRTSDFKTNEYANLIGGQYFEPKEDNPMLGFRGASRYYNDKYREGFSLECKALKHAREVIGMDNIIVMIPFCRTLEEADKVLKVMEENGLKKGENNLQVYVMCEIPSNVILAEEFSDRFDGFSIGSNDLTQFVLATDRDSRELSSIFDASNEAVKKMIKEVIKKAHSKNRKVGFCGQAPSDNPDFAKFLVEEGIDSISLNPDSVISVIEQISKIEK